MNAPADAFAAHCVELLAPLGAASARRMFGGHGLYLEGVMVGLVADEQLYLKTDAQSLAQWQAAGARPFLHTTRRAGVARTLTTSYWTPPAEAVESPVLMRPWARLALEAALRARALRPAKPRAKTKRPGAAAARKKAR